MISNLQVIAFTEPQTAEFSAEAGSSKDNLNMSIQMLWNAHIICDASMNA